MTFLFTDIEGSTRLLMDLGRDRYGEVLAAHHRLLRSAFVEADGIEIDTKGDSFFVVFRSAAAAVAAAGKVQLAIAEEDWPEGAEVRVRMGLHTGEASLSATGYIGLAVHEAARIGDAGQGGQVLLSATTAELVRGDLAEGLSLRDLGLAELRDLDETRLFQLVVEGLPSEFPPLSLRQSTKAKPRPRRRRVDVQISRGVLLEREQDLVVLGAAVEAAAAGSGRLVLIEGRAGMGKTRLVAEARALAGEAEFQVLVARPAELEQEFAYGVVRQLFEPFLGSLPDEERRALLAGQAGLAERLFDDEELTGTASADVSFAVLHGLYWLVANLSEHRPVAIVIDDLHWADAPTLRWLAYLGRRLEGLPLIVIAGSRPPEQSVHAELLTELASDPAARVMRPSALSRAAVAALALEQLGVEPEEEWVVACHSATGGNPLFVRALLDALLGEGLAPTAENARRVYEIGPQSVKRAVALRLSRLPEESRRLAAAAAVLGDGSDLREVAALAELEDPHLASLAATTLARADLVRSSIPAIEFVHPVVRTAVYEGVERSARLAAHRRSAELLFAAGEEPERVAAHLVLVPAAADPFVVETLRLAADRATVRGAPDAAVRYLRRALAEPPAADDVVVDVLCELGLAEQRVDLPAAAEHLAEALDSIKAPLRKARIALELGRTFFRLNRGPEAVGVLEQAVGELGDSEPELRHMLEAELINSAGFDSSVIDVSRDLRRRIDESTLVGEVGRAVMVATLRYFDSRRGVERESVRELADPGMLSALVSSMPSVAISSAASALLYAELDPELDVFFERILETARARGELVTVSNILCFRGLAHSQRGELGPAVRDLRESDELVPLLPSQQGAIYYRSYLADVLTNLGELDEAERALSELGLPEEVTESGHMIFFLGARGWTRLARGDHEGARSDFERLGRCMEAFDMHNPALLAWRSHLALALLGLGQRDEALELAREEVRLAREWGAPRALGVALRTQGEAEGGDSGIATLRESLAVLEGSSAKLERARTLVRLGASLRGDESRRLLVQGLELAWGCEARPLIAAAEAELAVATAAS